MANTEQGDYDLRGSDLRQLYAGFCRIPLSDSAVWSLSLAQATMPPNHIGFEAWITYVADADKYGERMAQWVKDLARTLATVKPAFGNRRRELLVRSYRQDWGDQAALDGLSLALWGEKSVPAYKARAEHFDCRWQAYKRIRDLIRAVVTMQMLQYESALAWAVRIQRRA